jgi:RimJ/RimL family protein N-acetyltransferase
MDIKPVTLTGRFVSLVPMNMGHAVGLAEVGLDPQIWQYMLYGEMHGVKDIERWVADLLQRQQRGGDLPFTVIHLASGRLAGATRYLNIDRVNRSLEIGGTWYGAEFQRTMVNTECKYLLLQYAFETLGCVRVQFKTDARNMRSQQAIERIGARIEGVLRNHMILPDGRLRDSVFYSVLPQEWPEVKARLERLLSN